METEFPLRVVGSIMELFSRGGLILGKALVLSAVWLTLFLPAGNPWIGVLVDEPYTLVAAMRASAGEVPYRDFFFLWTPGVIYLHAALQFLTQEWLYTGRIFLIFVGLALLWRNHAAAEAAGISRVGRIVIWCAALLWGIPQWNQPYASWYAIAILLLAAPYLGNRNFLFGLLVAAAFWFKQNIGLYGFVASLVFLFLRKRDRAVRLTAGFFAGLLPGIAYFASQGALSQLLSQTLAFPWVYRDVMAFPLSDVDFFHPTQGLFFTLTLLAFPAALFTYGKNRGIVSAEWEKYLLLAGAGFMQIYPRFDFTHFVFSFVCACVPLVWAVEQGGKWRRFGYSLLFILLLQGVWETGDRLRDTWQGKSISGLRSGGFVYDYLSEIRAVTDYLKTLGLKDGDPVVQIPVTTAFYFFSGLRNGTPHNQFFPMYVEAFGAKQEEVLRKYLGGTGRYVVLDRNAKAEQYVPELMRILERDFVELRRFPLTLSVWEPRSVLRK